MTEREMILRSAFWSGRFTYRKWRGILRRGPQAHRRVFVQAFLHLPMEWLLDEIGTEKFISIWPEVRKGFSRDSALAKTVCDAWDALWGVKAAGDSQYPIRPGIVQLARKRREVLKAIVSNPGISIYGLAKMTDRNYSRVFKDVRLLVEMDEVELRDDLRSRRKAKQIWPQHSVNIALAPDNDPVCG